MGWSITIGTYTDRFTGCKHDINEVMYYLVIKMFIEGFIGTLLYCYNAVWL